MSSTPVKSQNQLSDLNDDLDSVRAIAEIAKELTGVQLSDRHLNMVRSRIQGRLVSLGLNGPAEYLGFIRTHPTEKDFLIGAMTTHHTYFFREFNHFELLTQKVVPWLVARHANGLRKLRVWSAACSRGQEAYSLAMWLTALLEKCAPNTTLEILGTDIDPESVTIAKNGVYPWRELKEIPLNFLGSHWTRGTGEISDYAKAKSKIRSVCQFKAHNLLSGPTKVGGPFDIIFCRNVFIYFSPEQIRMATERLLEELSPEGFLFLGISESLHGLGLPLRSAGPSLYVRSNHPILGAAPSSASPVKSKVTEVHAPIAEKPVRLLIVEDSPSIQTLLRKVFDKESGFDVVGVANNGLEADRLRRQLNPDVMTLDIHMPEQNGIEYLRANLSASHPPVVMISSVSREDQGLASQALELGAADYVEKPALSNLIAVREEIRNKVRYASSFRSSEAGAVRSELELDRSFQKKVSLVGLKDKARVLVFQAPDRKRIAPLVRELSAPGQPPLILLLAASGAAADLLLGQIRREDSTIRGEGDLSASGLKDEERYLLSLSESSVEAVKKATQGRDLSILVVGDPSASSVAALKKLSGAKTSFLLEDLGPAKKGRELDALAKDYSPLSGFAYLSALHLGGSK